MKRRAPCQLLDEEMPFDEQLRLIRESFPPEEYQAFLLHLLRLPVVNTTARQKSGFLYLIRAEGTFYVKMGWSDEPGRRAAQLQTGCPHLLLIEAVLPAGRDEESVFAARIAASHVRGEWYVDDGLALMLAEYGRERSRP
jgi:hypothetical protein